MDKLHCSDCGILVEFEDECFWGDLMLCKACDEIQLASYADYLGGLNATN